MCWAWRFNTSALWRRLIFSTVLTWNRGEVDCETYASSSQQSEQPSTLPGQVYKQVGGHSTPPPPPNNVVQWNLAISNSVNSKSPLFRSQAEPRSCDRHLVLTRLFGDPAISTFFHVPWDFGIARFDYTYNLSPTPSSISTSSFFFRELVWFCSSQDEVVFVAEKWSLALEVGQPKLISLTSFFCSGNQPPGNSA